jgi:hypothetical protein
VVVYLSGLADVGLMFCYAGVIDAVIILCVDQSYLEFGG